MRKINPSVKMFVILICGLVISFHYSILWNSIMIGICFVLMLFSKVNMKKVMAVLIPATLAAASIFMAFALHGDGGGAQTVLETGNFLQATVNSAGTGNGLALATRIYAYTFLGMLFSFTTETNEFLYSLMQQCHLSPKFAYGVLAAYHLLPMIMREYKQIRLAYEVRGIHLMPWSLKPAFPALVNAVHWAENIAMAMESKGFDENGKRTWYMECKIHSIDILWGIVMILIAVLGIVL